MSISPIRRFDADDAQALERAAAAFCHRHGITVFDDSTALDECEALRDMDDSRSHRLAKLWQSAYCRALGLRPSARVCVAYGYVGMRDRT